MNVYVLGVYVCWMLRKLEGTRDEVGRSVNSVTGGLSKMATSQAAIQFVQAQ